MRREAIIAATALMTLATQLATTQLAAAQAASSQIINLSCDGERTLDGSPLGHIKPEITINLTDRTVSGVSVGFDVVVRTTNTDANAPNIQFKGQGPQAGGISVMGSIDRVTGLATVDTSFSPNDLKYRQIIHDKLTCKVTKPSEKKSD